MTRSPTSSLIPIHQGIRGLGGLTQLAVATYAPSITDRAVFLPCPSRTKPKQRQAGDAPGGTTHYNAFVTKRFIPQ